ncbi:hypothetical protein LCGC14_1333320, partial [marine sediment metagenome]
MRRAKWFCVALVGIVMLATSAYAQEEPGRGRRPGGPGGPGARRRRRPPKEALENFYAELVKVLELNEEQQKAVKQILDTHAQDMKNWIGEHGEELKGLRQQIMKAQKEGDREALKGLFQKMRELTKGQMELRQRMHKQILALLNDEQKEKFKKFLLRRRRAAGGIMAFRGALRRLDLTAEQKAKVAEIFKAAEAAAKGAEDRKDKAAIIRKAVKDVTENVLTDEQKAKLEKMRQRRGGPGGGPGRRGPGGGPLAQVGLTEA